MLWAWVRDYGYGSKVLVLGQWFRLSCVQTCVWCLQVIFALNQTLLHQESLRAGGLQVPYTTEDLIRHYNCGDLNSIIFNHDRSQVRSFSHLCSFVLGLQVTAGDL